MNPLELLARLAALIPPPRHPLVRFHGAFAPRSSWRRDVTPKPPAAPAKKPTAHRHESPPPRPQPPPKAPRAAAPAHSSLVLPTELLSPNILRIEHWHRLRAGALVATSARVDWPTLMRRTFDVDVLECPKCAGRLRIFAVVEDESLATQILTELALPRGPPAARAGDPDALLGADEPHVEC